MLNSFIFALLTSNVYALRMTSTNIEIKDIKGLAKVFVVNLDKRVDKCKCASYELRESPFEIVRWSASNVASWKQECPDMLVSGPLKHPEVPALVCSQYRIWKEMETNDLPYTIILEDDINVHPQFWEKTKAFLEGKLDQQDWDVAYVDVKAKNGAIYKYADTGEFHLLNPAAEGTESISGSHYMIFKKEALPKVLALGKKVFAPMDRFAKTWANEGLKVIIWGPGIVNQYSNSKNLIMPDNEFCAGSAKKSDIKKLTKIPSDSATDPVTLAFDCK